LKIENKKIKPNAQQQFAEMAGLVLFLETFVLAESSGFFSNFGAEKPPLLQAAKTL